MAGTRSVLVAGASSVQFPIPQPEIALPNLVKLELESSDPGSVWQAPAALLYPTPTMPERAMALLDRHKPDALYFICSAIYAEETVLFSIQRRWPRLYGAANAIEKRLEGPAGQPPAGESVRGKLFEVFRKSAKRLTGVAPLVDLEAAIDSTVRTFRAVAALPNLSVVCRLSAGGVRDESQTREIRRRVDEYNRAVSAECRSLGFTPLDLVGEMRHQGLEYTYEPDRIHGNLEARRFSARMAAAAILKDLGLPRQEASPV